MRGCTFTGSHLKTNASDLCISKYEEINATTGVNKSINCSFPLLNRHRRYVLKHFFLNDLYSLFFKCSSIDFFAFPLDCSFMQFSI